MKASIEKIRGGIKHPLVRSASALRTKWAGRFPGNTTHHGAKINCVAGKRETISATKFSDAALMMCWLITQAEPGFDRYRQDSLG